MSKINSFKGEQASLTFFASVPLGDMVKHQTGKQSCFQCFVCYY